MLRLDQVKRLSFYYDKDYTDKIVRINAFKQKNILGTIFTLHTPDILTNAIVVQECAIINGFFYIGEKTNEYEFITFCKHFNVIDMTIHIKNKYDILAEMLNE